ncbi:branched-chain amino acid ABC transporter permease [Roseospirillum parvum]|uniref:Branched-chain amino acid transport system permease protein n=1 Tax=Roseospirillum parvum TaxID=83401 RepID=A0A1G7UXI1_9PROT|nr:branched-chain amino acid ABC transporter permease [Roseospirillum parvum]SDG52206.1 branched-chain amino acid transport system permease protein [Roseospirillum parvum]
MDFLGLESYLVAMLTTVGIYAVLSLGLNVQFGLTGQINIGIAGFYAVGAYTAAILTTSESVHHLGGFGLPFVIGLAGAVLMSALIALPIGLVTIRLRSDYLAIATIGIAEIIRLVFKNEDWLSNGVRGIPGIERPLAGWLGTNAHVTLAVVLVVLAVVWWLCERARVSPWGRVLRAIRENEQGVTAAGKDVVRFRVQAFVVGAAIMGLGGALYAHVVGFISPEAFMPLHATFLVWVMLIAGGAGNNTGAIVGALIIWLVWSGTELVTGRLPPEFATQASSVRVLMIGVLLQVILIARPQGLLPERAPRAVGAARGRGK